MDLGDAAARGSGAQWGFEEVRRSMRGIRASNDEVVDMLALFLFMVGISSTIELKEIVSKLRRPKAMLIGMFAQYIFLPPVGFMVSRLIMRPGGLNGEIGNESDANLHAMGVALIAMCCSPGGTASNIMCQMFKADVALSISMTAVSSFVAFVALPVNIYVYLRRGDNEITIDAWDLSKFTLIVVVGSLIGLAVERYAHPRALKGVQVIGTLATLFLIAKSLVGNMNSSTPFWDLPWPVLRVVMLGVLIPIVCGHAFGVLMSLAFRVERHSAVAIALEVSIQNKLLALGLLGVIYPDKDMANKARLVPLMYGMFSITVNAVMLTIYWKLGWTKLHPSEPFYAPLRGICLSKVESTCKAEAAVGPARARSAKVVNIATTRTTDSAKGGEDKAIATADTTSGSTVAVEVGSIVAS